MRHLPALALAALTVAALASTGCKERSNMRELPDRGGHAYRTGGAERPLPSGAKFPYGDEQIITVQQGDNLKSLGKKYGVPEGWLIRRNDLQSNALEAGSTLIVPKAK
jgi:hypothetical protein